jgi:hypothetical protein
MWRGSPVEVSVVRFRRSGRDPEARIDAPMVVKGQFAGVADKTGTGRSGEGKLLLGHAPAGRVVSSGTAGESFEGQRLAAAD